MIFIYLYTDMSLKHVIIPAILTLLAIEAYAGTEYDSFSAPDTIFFEDGSWYYGEIRDSLFNGQGVMSYADSTVYKGSWKDGLWDGDGELYYPDGDSYSGQFKQHEFSGYGTYVYSDGNRYEGYWEYGLFNGAGTMHYADGSTFTGNWTADRKDGPGILYDSSTGTLIKGYFEGDRVLFHYGLSSEENKTQQPSHQSGSSMNKTPDDGKFHYRHLTAISVTYGFNQILSLHVNHHISDRFFAGGQFGFNTVSHTIGENSITTDDETGEKVTLVGWDWYENEILTESTYPFIKISGECGLTWRRFSIGTALGIGLNNTVRNCRSREENDSYFEPGTLYYRIKTTGAKFAYDFYTEFVPNLNIPAMDITLRTGYSNLDGFHMGMGVVF